MVAEVRQEFETPLSVSECAVTFREAVQGSYGGARRLFRLVNAIKSDGGGLEFFTPDKNPSSASGPKPAWTGGAFVPGFSKMYGASRMAIQAYVFDTGSVRRVVLIGPHSLGERGSTERLMQNIAARF